MHRPEKVQACYGFRHPVETLDFFEASGDMNNNPADISSAEDIVWRLPPSLAASRTIEENGTLLST